MRLVIGCLAMVLFHSGVLAQSLDVTVRPQEDDAPATDFENVYIALGNGQFVTFKDYIEQSIGKFDLSSPGSPLTVRIELGQVAEALDSDNRTLWARLVPSVYGPGPVDERAAYYARTYYETVPEFGRFGDGLVLASVMPSFGPINIGNSADLGLTPEGDLDLDNYFAYSLFEKPYNLADELAGGLTPQRFGYLPLRKYGFEK